jgi:Fe-S cluster assembly protein SufD
MSTVTTLAVPALPTKRDEAWRYAPHRELAGLTFGNPAAPTAELPADFDVPALDGILIVVVNGRIDPERSRLDPSREQLHLSEVELFTRSEVGHDGFEALNLAHATHGVEIRVAAGATVDAPIHIVDVAAPGEIVNTSSTSISIDLGAGSSTTVVESRLGVGHRVGGSSVRTTIELAADATLEHVVVQDLPAEQLHLGWVEARQAERSTLRTRSFNLGASYGRLAYDVQLSGTGAGVELSGLFVGMGEQILDQQITVVHNAEDCTSRQVFRGVLDDASTGVFNGGIDVCPGADGTDAEQSNDNLLLSNRAEVNTQPRLEILADEVACKHGATVGQLDDTALYYLRSRGINAEEARRLLINGFADEIVDDVGVEAVRTWITHRLGHDHD